MRLPKSRRPRPLQGQRANGHAEQSWATVALHHRRLHHQRCRRPYRHRPRGKHHARERPPRLHPRQRQPRQTLAGVAIVNAIVNINSRTITGTATIIPLNRRYPHRRQSNNSASWHHHHGSRIIAVIVADTINTAIARNHIPIGNASWITKAAVLIIVMGISCAIIATAATHYDQPDQNKTVPAQRMHRTPSPVWRGGETANHQSPTTNSNRLTPTTNHQPLQKGQRLSLKLRRCHSTIAVVSSKGRDRERGRCKVALYKLFLRAHGCARLTTLDAGMNAVALAQVGDCAATET